MGHSLKASPAGRHCGVAQLLNFLSWHPDSGKGPAGLEPFGTWVWEGWHYEP